MELTELLGIATKNQQFQFWETCTDKWMELQWVARLDPHVQRFYVQRRRTTENSKLSTNVTSITNSQGAWCSQLPLNFSQHWTKITPQSTQSVLERNLRTTADFSSCEWRLLETIPGWPRRAIRNRPILGCFLTGKATLTWRTSICCSKQCLTVCLKLSSNWQLFHHECERLKETCRLPRTKHHPTICEGESYGECVSPTKSSWRARSSR